MTGALQGLRILVPESRELDLFAGMLEAEGASTLRCPLVRILDLDDTLEASAWIGRLIAGEFEDVVWLTGEGVRRLLAIADRYGGRGSFIAALGLVRNITRGPKPARALRELGLSSGLAATTPTSQGVLEAFAGEDIAGRTIGIQLYPGEGTLPLVAHLRERGATVFPVTSYRYASQAETARVAEAIDKLSNGSVDMIAFTSSPQVERLLAIAREAGRQAQLAEALNQIRIAAVGPVVEETLERHGLTADLRPDTAFHLKPLVRVIAAAWSPR